MGLKLGGIQMKQRPSKRDMIKEAGELANTWRIIDDRLFKLVDQKKVTSGCLMIHLCHDNYGWKCISKIAYDPKKYNPEPWSSISISLASMYVGFEKARDFVEEQEKLAIKDCQFIKVYLGVSNVEVKVEHPTSGEIMTGKIKNVRESIKGLMELYSSSKDDFKAELVNPEDLENHPFYESWLFNELPKDYKEETI